MRVWTEESAAGTASTNRQETELAAMPLARNTLAKGKTCRKDEEPRATGSPPSQVPVLVLVFVLVPVPERSHRLP